MGSAHGAGRPSSRGRPGAGAARGKAQPMRTRDKSAATEGNQAGQLMQALGAGCPWTGAACARGGGRGAARATCWSRLWGQLLGASNGGSARPGAL
eukprot:5911912-Pyramimonas_sp.AAC.1